MAASRGGRTRPGSSHTCSEAVQSQNSHDSRADVNFSNEWCGQVAQEGRAARELAGWGVQKPCSLWFWWFTWQAWWALQLSRQSNGWISVASCLSSAKRSLKKMFHCKTFLFQWIRSFCWNRNVLLKTCCVGKLPTICLAPTPIERKWIVCRLCFLFRCFSYPVLPLVPTQGSSHKACIC